MPAMNETVSSPAKAVAAPTRSAVQRWVTIILIAACAVLALAVGSLWIRLSHLQQNLARQSLASSIEATEARTLAKTAQETSRELGTRLGVMESKVSEVALQRTQLEGLIQSLSRSRDDNMVVDMDAALRLAQQQAQLTGSVEPLLAALKSAEARLARAALPRLAPLQRTVQRDIERIKTASVADVSQMVQQIDELARSVDELPLANRVGAAGATATPSAAQKSSATKNIAARADNTPASGQFSFKDQVETWWHQLITQSWTELRQLVRVSRIDTPEAALLAPEQSFFLRENLKLKLLNARLALITRQVDTARADLSACSAALAKYYDNNQKATQNASAQLARLQAQTRQLDLPRIDESLTALTTAAVGR
jgi:uroporphyrin-III C-methyltransferase